MEETKNCACSAAPKLIFACSGASDVGRLSDLAARHMTKEQIGKMYCLAGIGGGLNDFIETTKMADKILVIDGCVADCAKHTMEKAGFKSFGFIRLSDLGFEKGKTSVTSESINVVAKKGKELLSCC